MDAGAINPLSLSLAASNMRQPAQELAARREMVQAVEAINKTEAFGQNQELTFSFDQEKRRTVMRLVDRTTGEVIAQLPPERVLKMARTLMRR